MYKPVSGLNPVLVNHEVNMWGAVGVITRVDSGHLHHAIRVGVPTTTEPSLFAIETIGIVSAVVASRIGWWENSSRESPVTRTHEGAHHARALRKHGSSGCRWYYL